MKLIQSTLLLTLLSHFSWSQTPSIDSLKHELAIARVDTQRVLLLSDIGDSYRNINVDSAILFDQRAITLARKIKFSLGEIRSLRRLAFVFRISGNTPKALEINFKTLKLAVSENLTSEQANFLSQIGSIYSDENEFSEAFLFLRASNRLVVATHRSLAVLGINQTVMGRTYCKMNQLDSALYYCVLAQKNIQTLEMAAINARDMGLIYSKKGDKKRALAFFLKSIHLLKGDDNLDPRSRSNYQTAIIYQQSNQPDSAIYFANQALDDGRKGNFYARITEASTLLSELHTSKNAAKALQYSNMAIAYKDSLYLRGKRNAIQNLRDFDEKEQQYEIETAQTAYKNRVKQVALFAGLGVVVLIAIVLYRNSRKEKKAKNLLQKQKEQIESTLAQLRATQNQLIQREKMASLGELTAGIAHEIQNPLNFVNNFAEVSVELVGELMDELPAELKALPPGAGELLDDLAQNLQRITLNGQRASNIVKGMLEHSRPSTGEREPTNLNALCEEYLRLAYQGARVKDNNFSCQLNTNFDSGLPLVSVVASDLSRVLLNLFNNAFYTVGQKQKTATADYQPVVIVSTRQVDGHVQIHVKDNGMGIPEAIKEKIFQPFFTTKPTGEGTGLGLSLSYEMITKGHEGMLTVDSLEGVGADFLIELPYLRGRL